MKEALYLWKRCPQGSLRAVDMASQQMAQSSSLAASSSAVATANLQKSYQISNNSIKKNITKSPSNKGKKHFR